MAGRPFSRRPPHQYANSHSATSRLGRVPPRRRRGHGRAVRLVRQHEPFGAPRSRASSRTRRAGEADALTAVVVATPISYTRNMRVNVCRWSSSLTTTKPIGSSFAARRGGASDRRRGTSRRRPARAVRRSPHSSSSYRCESIAAASAPLRRRARAGAPRSSSCQPRCRTIGTTRRRSHRWPRDQPPPHRRAAVAAGRPAPRPRSRCGAAPAHRSRGRSGVGTDAVEDDRRRGHAAPAPVRSPRRRRRSARRLRAVPRTGRATSPTRRRALPARTARPSP